MQEIHKVKYKTMKLSNATVAIILLSFLLTSCDKDELCKGGNNVIETNTLSVPSFRGIDFKIAGNVNISQGNTQEVSVTGDANIIENIDTDISGGVWDIDFGSDCFDHYDLTVNITTPNIEELVLSGSGNITLNNFTGQGDLSLEISGSGKINLDEFVGCEDLSIKINGSGTIHTNSEFPDLKNIDIRISGSGDYEGFPISTDECNINISGSGNCEVFVRERLDVKISGSGNVFYKGSPTVSTDISSSGSVIDAN
jgi:hypothetical protein